MVSLLDSLPLHPRQLTHLLSQTLTFALILSTAYMLWKGLSLASNSKSPIVVVLSGSMEPAFERGDLLFLWNRNLGWADHLPPAYADLSTTDMFGNVLPSPHVTLPPNTRVGEIVVYEVKDKDIPIVHRVIRRYGGKVDETEGAELRRSQKLHLLTKGDNNAADDTSLYAQGQTHLERERDVVGTVVGYVPWVGYGTILLSEYPWLKTVMIGLMGLGVLLQRE